MSEKIKSYIINSTDTNKIYFQSGIGVASKGTIEYDILKGFAESYKQEIRVTLFGDRVLIKPDETEKVTEGGIVIPDTAQKTNRYGTVIKHGEGAYDEKTGDFIPITVKEGDRIIYDTTAQIIQSPEWDNLLLMKESDILTIITKT